MPSSTLLAAAEAAPLRRRQRRRGRPPSESVTLHLSVFRSLRLPSRDWAELPSELVSSVLHRLDPVQIMLAADKVCRSWRRAARDEPELWRRVDMRGHRALSFRGLVDLDKMAADAVLRSRGQCEAFCGEGFDVDDDLLRFLADQAPSLKSLILIRCNKVSDQGFLESIKRFSQLEELELLDCLFVYSREVLGIVAKACPRLKHLRHNLNRRHYNDDFGYDHIDDREAMAIATLHELRSLRLIHNELSNQGLAAILKNCLHLESLDLRHCCGIRMDGAMRAKCARIKTVNLHRFDPDHDWDWDRDYDLYPISECLTCENYFAPPIKDMHRNHYVSDKKAKVIAAVRELRSLILDRNDLTNQGVSAILDKCPHLDSVDILNCRDIIMTNTKNNLRAKYAKIKRSKTKKVTTMLLCRDLCNSDTFSCYGLDINKCAKIVMNSCWYKDAVANKGSGAWRSRTNLRKRMRNYHRKTKSLFAYIIKYKIYWEQRRNNRDLNKIKSMERTERQELGTSECSTCLMFEYFVKNCEDLNEEDDYADYYDPWYGLDNHDETELQMLDRMLGKKFRRYLRSEDGMQMYSSGCFDETGCLI
ncbi:hypothetical protein ACP70R_045228 [Stipagrostis hirtigluma subsp. patula]